MLFIFLLTFVLNIVIQLTRLEIENYNQQTETESTIEMNQHLQVRKRTFFAFQQMACEYVYLPLGGPYGNRRK